MPNAIRREKHFRYSFNLLLLRWHFYVGIVWMKTGVRYKIQGERAPHSFAGYTIFFCVLLSLSAFSRSLVVSLAVTYYGIYGRVVGRLLSARGDASKVLIFRIFWHYTRLWAWLYHTECNNPFAKFFLSRSFFMLIVLFTLLSYLVRFQNESPIFVCFIFFFLSLSHLATFTRLYFLFMVVSTIRLNSCVCVHRLFFSRFCWNAISYFVVLAGMC